MGNNLTADTVKEINATEEVESYIADTLVGLNCHDKAIVMYKDVMSKYGEYIYSLEMLAYALQLSGKYKESIIHCERIIEILDDNIDIEKTLNYLAIIFDINIYYKNEDNCQEIIERVRLYDKNGENDSVKDYIKRMKSIYKVQFLDIN